MYVVSTKGSLRNPLTLFPDKKCHPEPESSTSARNRSIDESEKRGSQYRTKDQQHFHSSKHHSQDMASSITKVQEPEKAYSTDVNFTVRTSVQPTPIDPMNLPPDFMPKPVFKAPAHAKRSSVQSNGSSQAPILPLPSLSQYDSRSPRRQSDTTAAHRTDMGSGKDAAMHSQCHAVESIQDPRPPR